MLGNRRWRLLKTMLSCQKPSGQGKERWSGAVSGTVCEAGWPRRWGDCAGDQSPVSEDSRAHWAEEPGLQTRTE